MPGTNEFLPVAVGPGSYVSTTPAWQASARRQTGFQSGIVPGPDFNKAFRQPSVMASVVGSFIATRGFDALDNGDLAALQVNFEGALGAFVGATAPVVPGVQRVHFGLDTGTTNSLVVNVSPDIASYEQGALYLVRALNAPTGPAVANLDNRGARSVTRADGTPIQAGDWGAGEIIELRDDGTLLRLSGVRSSQMPTRRLAAFTTPGAATFTVPDGVFWIFAECVGAGGGGGGGGGGVAWASGGGGSGGYAAGWFGVVPGQVINLVVGAKGAGASNANNEVAGTGGTTSIGTLMQATGGLGGRGGSAGSQGGTPGLGSGGQRNFYGSNGGDGNPYKNDVQGGQGAASAFGGGGRTSTVNATFMNGLAPGSGGGGVWYTNPVQQGGTGADGAIFIQF